MEGAGSTAAAVLGLVLFAPLALWDLLHISWSSLGPGDWLAVIWWGAGTFALGSWLWFKGMADATAGTASAFMAVMPVSALVLSYILLGEAFQWVHLVGLVLVLLGLAAVIRGDSSAH